MSFFLLVLFLQLSHNGWLLPPCSAKIAPFDIASDAYSLLAFRDHFLLTTNLSNILRTNWTSASNATTSSVVCHWIGVTCGARHQRVVALDLGDMGLAGTIPSHFGNLSFLRVLNISSNKFHGQLPKEMAGLHRLSSIDVSFNSLSGNIPAWFGLLPQLKYLDIHNNSFTGPIPPFLSNASKLKILDISSNLVNGMIPVELGNLHNLQHLKMSFNQLTGEIPRSIFNLTLLEKFSLYSNGISGGLPEDMCTSLPKLRLLDLAYNELEGHIQSSLQFCARLEKLSLAYNKFHGPLTGALENLTMLNLLYLTGNDLKGDIPSELAHLVNLKELGLGSAGLGGSIPPSIFMNMTSLEGLYLDRNSLSRSIPNEIGNCTSIIHIEMGDNQLTGQVPEHIGRLHKLEFLSLHVNNLGGHVPTNLFNITSLRFLDPAENHLTRHLPANTGSGLPNLEELYLNGNRFSGTIPDSISNSSGLTILSLGSNQFTGSPPTSLGNLRLLNWLSIDDNNLRLNAKEFIVSLSFMHLRLLSISSNQVNGPLPSSFGNLTSSLYVLGAEDCGIIGKIPGDILNMSNLQTLILSSNHLVGSLPHMLSRLSNMDQLYASDNNLSGLIPDDICHLPRLGALQLHANKFFGPLPDCLGNMTSLRTLNLHINELSRSIPASLWPLRDILQLDLSSNSFTGYLPQDIGTLRAATYINISSNQLSGTLPSTIGSVQTLVSFSLAHNKFEGSIPESFGKLLSMEQLDLSYNNLSGEIPKSLQTLSYLKILNLSFNQLSGEKPSTGPFKNLTYLSFVSNKALCGSPRFHVPQCQSDGSSKHLTKRRMVLLFVYAMIGMTLLTLVVLAALYVILKCRKKQQIPWVEDFPVALERVSYHELLRATNSFDDSNLLGKGSFGSVYKAVFANGRTWAVKVFHFQVERAIKSFDTECEMLRNIRHKNLTKVVSSCTNLDFMALVLEYMPNGSLEKWLYSHNYLLDVKQRLDVMIDVASALEYLHIGYSVPVVHCDLKPGNVLLDEDMVAHVSDFGISKFLKEEGGIVQTNTLATVGYTAPEYGREGIVSTKCDVYSFGIMLMEVFTRRRPTEEMFSGDLDLIFWVNQSLPDRVMEIIDENLLRQEENQDSAMVQCVSLILDVASNCSSNLPDERMDMKDVLALLKKIKLRLHADLA